MELTLENLKSILLDFLSENLQQQYSPKKLSEAHAVYLRWAEFNLSEKTISGVHTSYKHLISFRGDIYLSEINSLFVDMFMIELMKKAPRGYSVYFRTLRAEFNKLLEWSLINVNHFAKYKLPKQQRNEKKIFDENELLFLLDREQNQVLKALYLFCFFTGLRLSEIINLCWNNVFLKDKYILIGDAKFKTKSRNIRKVPLCNKVINILEELRPKIFKVNSPNYIFCKNNGYKFTGNYVSKRFKKLLRAVGYDEGYTFHSLRHSTASNLARFGIPVPHIQQILGHSDLKITMTYTHNNLSDLVKSVSVFDNEITNNKKKEN
jgi:integrase/recombinase XerD